MKSRFFLGLAISLILGLPGCGYFNSLYNARRQFADAERAAATGRESQAQQAYTGAIEKAAKSYRKYPRGRWSDDALHLIARARFELGEYPAARAAATELLNVTTDAHMRGDAHAIVGASALQMQDDEIAIAHLDSAMVGASEVMRGRVHLWRARAYRATGEPERAWADLDAVPENDPSYVAVQLDRIAFGIEQRDSARTAAAFATLLNHRDARRNIDTISDLALHAVSNFGAATTRNLLNAPLPDWLASARDSVALVRAELALRSGDTVAATTELTQLASRSSVLVANAARVKLARSRMPTAATLEDLREIRALLLPAVADPSVPAMLHNLKIVEALVQKAQSSGQPLALFAAAEIARDDLGAKPLARRLFITFVDMAPNTPWSAKALLAALAIAPDADDAGSLRARLATYRSSPYAQALESGGDPEAFVIAEERLQRSLIALREEGAQLANQQDVAVTRVVATLDSLRTAARTDSAKVSCGLMIDTLAIIGTRADSVRVACMRADTIKLAEYMKIDTMVWRPDLRKPGDSIGARRRLPPRTIKRDSIKQ
jgi:tetratricopeptide (TPR) repeat protein